MSGIHFVGGEKGGVGKSLFSRLLCEWFLEHSIKLCAIDADPSQGTLSRGYAAYGHPVKLSAFASADRIMDRALSAERQVVVDLPAQSLGQLVRWIEAGDIVGLASELGVAVTYYHLTDGGSDSVSCLEAELRLIPPSARVTVVCNHGRSKDFSQIEASAPLRLVRERGGKVISLPAVDPEIMYKIDGQPARLTDAFFDETKEGPLTVMQRRRAAVWLALAYAEIEPLLSETVKQRKVSLDDASGEESLVAPVACEPFGAAPAAPAAPAETGNVIIDGAATWTEVGERSLTHHVRCT
jgi:hypothetical protein